MCVCACGGGGGGGGLMCVHTCVRVYIRAVMHRVTLIVKPASFNTINDLQLFDMI